jgi:hypothetical protein
MEGKRQKAKGKRQKAKGNDPSVMSFTLSAMLFMVNRADWGQSVKPSRLRSAALLL